MSRWSVAVAVLLVLGCKEQREPDRAATTGLRDGDLIFHESRSAQSEMVRALTGSRWTHMGVVFEQQGKLFVFEAISPVKYTPLAEWTKRGQGGQYVVKRLRDAERRLSPAVLAKIRALGKSWLGRPYDSRFRWDDQSLYCSELAYKLFDRAAGVQLGKLQTAADMNLDDPRVQQALQKRFAGVKFDPKEVVVTPDSMFNDPQLVEVDSQP
jgi:hypothetical protein